MTFSRLLGTFNFFRGDFFYILHFLGTFWRLTFSDFLGIFGTCLGLFWYFFGSLVDFLGAFFNFSRPFELFCKHLKKKTFFHLIF